MLENTRLMKEIRATEGIGNPYLLAFSFLIVVGLISWLFSIGNLLSGLAVIVVYGLAARSRFIGPYLGFELPRWEDQRDRPLEE